MKRIIGILLSSCCLFSSCFELDLNPLSQGSSENWYSNETEIDMALKNGYNPAFWYHDSEEWTDDYTYRDSSSPIINGTLNGQNGSVTGLWANMYKAIARANTVLSNLQRAEGSGITPEKLAQFRAEACFLRASMYSQLVSHFGDVVYVTEVIDIDEAFKIGRSKLSEILPKIYEDFDTAIEGLPEKHPFFSAQRATKGAALAMKARLALHLGDWQVVADAAGQCIELGLYQLHPSFEELFFPATKNSKESIFVLPRSLEENVVLWGHYILSRNVGGWAGDTPSWDLLASFLCSDGLPIDESPLFDSHDPFKNRDPRCSMTIVPFKSNHLGFEYNPHPEALEVMNYNTGKMQKNQDTRANAQYASFNGLLWKKGINASWLQNGFKVDPDNIIIRYADVLLMYAEAMIELNKIDQSVLDAINAVRARAYGVDKSATTSYPAVTETNQAKLRKIVRMERRMEFANEGLRYMDLVRWKLASVSLSRNTYGMLYPSSLLIEKVTSKGGWFWPSTPEIDENGLPDFTKLEQEGLINVLSKRTWNNRQYLWPIPTKEILINKNLTQNPGY